MSIEFQAWPKIPRLFKDMVVTEKIDGTNAAVLIVPTNVLVGDDVTGFTASLGYAERWVNDNVVAFVEHEGTGYAVAAQSRKRLITPESDNFGFARWVRDHAADLVELLGEGRHFGEWWGSGIQRGYGLERGLKHFSLFNIDRYADVFREFEDGSKIKPVPTFYQGPFDLERVQSILRGLAAHGSAASPGFMKPEGVVVFHAGGRGDVFKAFVDDEEKAQEVRGR